MDSVLNIFHFTKNTAPEREQLSGAHLGSVFILPQIWGGEVLGGRDLGVRKLGWAERNDLRKTTRNSRDTACGPQRELNNVYLSFPNP